MAILPVDGNPAVKLPHLTFKEANLNGRGKINSTELTTALQNNYSFLGKERAEAIAKEAFIRTHSSWSHGGISTKEWENTVDKLIEERVTQAYQQMVMGSGFQQNPGVNPNMYCGGPMQVQPNSGVTGVGGAAPYQQLQPFPDDPNSLLRGTRDELGMLLQALNSGYESRNAFSNLLNPLNRGRDTLGLGQNVYQDALKRQIAMLQQLLDRSAQYPASSAQALNRLPQMELV